MQVYVDSMHLLNLGNHEHIIRAAIFHIRAWLLRWDFFSTEDVNAVFERLEARLKMLDSTSGGMSFNDWNARWPVRVNAALTKHKQADRLKAHEMETMLLVCDLICTP
jgi:hypothetical protein